MIVEYYVERDPMWSHDGDRNFIGMPDNYVYHDAVEFCCPTMKQKWHKQVGFHGTADKIGLNEDTVCLFWSLTDKASELLFWMDDRNWRKDKIEECPFCHAEIELRRINGKKR
jgi:hypothetical protein